MTPSKAPERFSTLTEFSTPSYSLANPSE